MSPINIRIFSPSHEYEAINVDPADITDLILSLADDVARGVPNPAHAIFMNILREELVLGMPEQDDRASIARRSACAALGCLSQEYPLDEIAELRHIVVDARPEGLRISTIMVGDEQCDSKYENALAVARTQFPIAPANISSTIQ